MNDVLGLVLLSAGALGAAVFVGLYSRRADWWHNEIGWHLVTLTSALGLLMLNGLAFRVFGNYPGRQTVNLVLFAVTVGSVWWRVALLLRATRRDRRDR